MKSDFRGAYIEPRIYRGDLRDTIMDNYCNLERVRQAFGLYEKTSEYNRSRNEGQPKLGGTELHLLLVLARKMGRKTDIRTGEVENGCRASLETLEREAGMERKAIGNSLGKLIDAGFITQTYDRDLRTELTREGKRRLERGLPLDNPAKNNYQRQQMGARRKDGAGNGQWKHCVYHIVPAVWDSVVFDSREVRETTVAPVSAEDQAVVDSIDLPVATKSPASAAVSKKQADEVFENIKFYFAGHNTLVNQSEKDARRSMNATCVELAQRALDLGDIEYANNFLWWMINRRNTEWLRLTNKVQKLGSPVGLLKSVSDLWDEFIPEKDDEIGPDGPGGGSASDEPESMNQDFVYGDDVDDEPVKATESSTPVFTFDDDTAVVSHAAAPAQEGKPEPPANPFRYQREAFLQALVQEPNLLRRPSEAFTLTLDPEKDVCLGWVGKWLDAVPYGRQIVYERMGQSSKSILRVEIKWNVARYIVAHAEQFIEDGYIDELYQPEIDPEVLAEIEVERKSAEEREREISQKRQEEAEAAEEQPRKDAEAAEVQRKKKILESNIRRVLIDHTDQRTFCFPGKSRDVSRVAEYLHAYLPNTVTIMDESDSMLEGEVSSSLIEAWKADPIGFRDNGYVEMDADRELAT